MSARLHPRPPARPSRWLLVAMVGAVVVIGGLAVWDADRESAAALDDFAAEQAMLARSVAAELASRLAVARRDALLLSKDTLDGSQVPEVPEGYEAAAVRQSSEPPLAAHAAATRFSVTASGGRVVDLVVPASKLLQGAARIEQPGAIRALLLAPHAQNFQASDGHVVQSAALMEALRAGQSSQWLDRAEAARLGLPERRAAAGLSQLDAGPLGHWGIAVVSSAERERDRELRARVRLFLSVGLAAGLVFLFGSVARRNQRRELELERELVIATAERQRDDQLAQANRVATLGTLAMGIAHEISTPLGVISGRAEQLFPRVAGDLKNARAVRAILDEAEKIRVVIRGFLDLARGGPPALAAVDARAVLESAVDLVRHRFEKAGVALVVDAPGAAADVRADAVMLGQAVANLLLNACDASKSGGRVDAAVFVKTDRVAIAVTDEGAGIPPEAAARVLEPFFTTKAPDEGSGLGLAIANEIVKLHRGVLVVEARVPRGTRACIELPLPTTLSHAA